MNGIRGSMVNMHEIFSLLPATFSILSLSFPIFNRRCIFFLNEFAPSAKLQIESDFDQMHRNIIPHSMEDINRRIV